MAKPIDSRPGGFDWVFYPGATASVALSRCPVAWATAALVVNVAATPSGTVLQTGTATPHDVGDGTVTLTLELSAVTTEALGAGSFFLELLVDTLPTIVVSLLGSYTAAQPRNPLAVSVNPRGQATVVEVVPTGPVGPGVPSGGATGRVLAKASSTDYDTEWIDPASQAELDAHLNDTAAAHAASAISATPAGGLTGDTVAAQLAELDTEKATVGSVSAIEAELGTNPSGSEATVAARLTAIESAAATDAELSAHIDDTTDAHDATAISYAGSSGISATTVEAALDELDTEKLNKTTAVNGTIVSMAGALDASATAGDYTQAQQAFSAFDGTNGVRGDSISSDTPNSTGASFFNGHYVSFDGASAFDGPGSVHAYAAYGTIADAAEYGEGCGYLSRLTNNRDGALAVGVESTVQDNDGGGRSVAMAAIVKAMGTVTRWARGLWVTSGGSNAAGDAIYIDGASGWTNALVYKDTSGTTRFRVDASGATHGTFYRWTYSSDRFFGWASGSPEGVVAAAPGALLLNVGGGAGTTLYIKESGTGNTGWVAK